MIVEEGRLELLKTFREISDIYTNTDDVEDAGASGLLAPPSFPYYAYSIHVLFGVVYDFVKRDTRNIAALKNKSHTMRLFTLVKKLLSAKNLLIS